MKHIFKLILLFNFSFSLEVEDMNIGNVYSILNRNECEGFSQDECEYLDYCEWIADSDNPNSWGMCVEVGNEDIGPPECILDCAGINDLDESIPDELCDWIISTFGNVDPLFSSCFNDCDDVTMEWIYS